MTGATDLAHLRNWAVWLCLLASAAGCTHTKHTHAAKNLVPIPPPLNEGPMQGGVTPVPASNPFAALDTYLLRAGDQIAFTLHVPRQPEPGDYHVRVGDKMTVDYLHLAPTERTPIAVQVKPDGTIDLPLIGQVSVAGQTVKQVNEKVNAEGQRYWKHPQIALSVSNPLEGAEELRRAFSVGGVFNQTLTLPVGPDGTVELPLIGTVHVFGRTLVDLRKEINERYQAHVSGVEITPYLAQRAPDRVYVLGEVAKPGMLTLERPTTVIQAIAQAGSWTRSAELREVALIRGYTEGAPRATLLNLDKAIDLECHRDKLDLTDDVWLQDGDIVVVPMDELSNWNDFIDRLTVRSFDGAVPIIVTAP